MDYRRIRVAAVLLNGHHVLMVRNEENHWELPGGEAEEGEMPEDAVIRAVAEQTGAAVKVLKTLHRAKDVHRTHRIELTFLVEAVGHYDPLTTSGTQNADWRSLRSPELKEKIYDRFLAGRERQ